MAMALLGGLLADWQSDAARNGPLRVHALTHTRGGREARLLGTAAGGVLLDLTARRRYGMKDGKLHLNVFSVARASASAACAALWQQLSGTA